MKRISKSQFWCIIIGIIVGAIIGANHQWPERYEASDITIKIFQCMIFCGIVGALILPIANEIKRWIKSGINK
jgi:ammonia channel protein AmtB